MRPTPAYLEPVRRLRPPEGALPALEAARAPDSDGAFSRSSRSRAQHRRPATAHQDTPGKLHQAAPGRTSGFTLAGAHASAPAARLADQWTAGLLAVLAAWLAMRLLRAILHRIHLHRTFRRMQVPAPKAHLISGNLYETRREPYVKFAHRLHERYGKTVGYFLGGDPFLMTKDLELIKQVFVANSRLFYDRMPFYLNVEPVPDNLICQRGDRWRYMRRLLTPAFSGAKVRSSQFYLDTQKTVQAFMEQLDRNLVTHATPQGSARLVHVEDSYDRMAAVALDVIIKTAFHMEGMVSFRGPLSCAAGQSITKGKRGGGGGFVEKQPSEDDAFLSTVKRACRLGFNPLVELIFCFPFLDKPLTFLGNRLYFGSIIQLLFNRLDYLVRKDAAGSQAQPSDKHNRKRIIDSLIEVLREKKISRSEFTGNAFVIVFAGFETTANALTFCLWLLAKHPAVQVKLRQSIQERLKQFSATKANEQDDDDDDDDEANKQRLELELAELACGCEYLEMVLNEALRLYPPVPALSCRQASQDCQLSSGQFIEKGVNVIPSVFSIHRDKEIWGADANQFRPERFELLDIQQLNSAIFMPFGLGPRNCIGKGVAMHEMKIVVGRLVQRYSIECCPGRTPSRLKLCSPINITITNSEKIGLNFRKL